MYFLSRDDEVFDKSALPSSSIHRFLWRLRNTVHLSELRLEGEFEDDVWRIDSSGSVCDGLRPQFEDYVCCRGSSFPLAGLGTLSDERVFHALSNEKASREYLGEWIEKWHADLGARYKDQRSSWWQYRRDHEDAGHTG